MHHERHTVESAVLRSVHDCINDIARAVMNLQGHPWPVDFAQRHMVMFRARTVGILGTAHALGQRLSLSERFYVDLDGMAELAIIATDYDPAPIDWDGDLAELTGGDA